MVGYRRLRLLGRHDDLVNLGGIKWSATEVEADLRRQPAIADCAVQAVHLDDGAVSLGVALVCAPDATQEAATAQLREALETWGAMTVRLVFVPALPKLAAGKVDRMALLRLLHESPAR
jgi:acyl-coenzyme A synthetase/AMP-(fatty) acid ligase